MPYESLRGLVAPDVKYTETPHSTLQPQCGEMLIRATEVRLIFVKLLAMFSGVIFNANQPRSQPNANDHRLPFVTGSQFRR